jgi:hypothetical protein
LKSAEYKFCHCTINTPLIHINSKHYPGIEPSTFGDSVGNNFHCTI